MLPWVAVSLFLQIFHSYRISSSAIQSPTRKSFSNSGIITTASDKYSILILKNTHNTSENSLPLSPRSPHAILQRLHSFPHTSPAFFLKIMVPCPRTLAKPSFRPWSCYETRMSSHQSSTLSFLSFLPGSSLHDKPCSLLKCLFPLLPRTTSPTLRTFIRKTILSDIRTANMRSKNHKLNRAVQAMLFSMIERGIEGDVVGDRGKPRASTADPPVRNGEEAMWAVILTKELWRKGTWFVSFVLS